MYDGGRVNAREGGRATDCERITFDGRQHLGVEASLGCVEWCGERGCVVYRGQGHMNQRPG